MTIFYLYDEAGVYCGSAAGGLKPERGLAVPPPPLTGPLGAVVNDGLSGWEVAPDYRGLLVRETSTGREMVWDRIGPLPEGWEPPPAPEPAESAIDLTVQRFFLIEKLKGELDELDAEYLKPYTLANLALGDPVAVERKSECDALKAPLKAELTRLEQEQI